MLNPIEKFKVAILHLNRDCNHSGDSYLHLELPSLELCLKSTLVKVMQRLILFALTTPYVWLRFFWGKYHTLRSNRLTQP